MVTKEEAVKISEQDPSRSFQFTKSGVMEFKDGELVKETTKEGTSVARVLISEETGGRGPSGGRRVSSARDLELSRTQQAQQEAVNIQLRDTGKEARVVTDVRTREATAQVVDRPVRQTLTPEQRVRPVVQMRNVEDVRREQQEELQERLLTREQIKREQPEAFTPQADPRLILGGERDTLITGILGGTGVAATGAGIALAPTPLAPLGGALIAGGLTLSGKAAARAQEEFAGTRLSQEERQLITQPQFVAAFSGAIAQSQEEFRQRNPIITERAPFVSPTGAATRVAGALNVGISTTPEDFQKNLRSQLESRGFSPQEVETGLRIGQERRTTGVVSDVLEVVGAGVGAEKGARVILGAGSTLSSRITATATVGALEGGALTAGQARVVGADVTPTQVGLGAALGAVSAGTITATIGRAGQFGGLVARRTGKRVAERTTERLFTAIDPSEAIVDITTSLGEQGIRRTRTPKTPVRPITGDTITFERPTQPISVGRAETFEGFRVEQVTTRQPRERSPVVSSVARDFVPIETPTRPQQVPSRPQTIPREVTDTFSFVGVRTQPRTDTRTQPFTSIRTSPQISARVSPRVSTIQGVPALTLPPRRGGGQQDFGFNLEGGRQKQYVASLAAVGLGITGERAEQAELTGIGLRPIVRRPRKKSSKRKKK